MSANKALINLLRRVKEIKMHKITIREVAEKKWQEYQELIDRIKRKTQPIDHPESGTVTLRSGGETGNDSPI